MLKNIRERIFKIGSTKYKEWVEANIDNPNRTHTLDWIDEQTIVIYAYDKVTKKGVEAIFKMDSCEEFDRVYISSDNYNTANIFPYKYKKSE